VVAMGFGSRANVAVAIAARFSATPYVATVGNLGADFSDGAGPAGLLRRLHALTHGAAYASVFNNPGDLALFRRSHMAIGRRLLVLPGAGVNLTRFPHAPLQPAGDHVPDDLAPRAGEGRRRIPGSRRAAEAGAAVAALPSGRAARGERRGAQRP